MKGAMASVGVAMLTSVAGPASAQCDHLTAWGSNEQGGLANLPSDPMIFTSCNYNLGVGIGVDGQVRCWGSPDLRLDMPRLQSVTKVCAGADWVLALTAAGAVAAWGGNAFGQINVPGGVFRDIAAGDWHSLALDAKGRIVTWGSSNFGLALVPEGVFAQLATGNWHSLAITSDGYARGWGWNDFGQATPPANGRFLRVAGGWKHTVGIQLDGTLLGWGADEAGCLSSIPQTGNYREVDANGGRCVALREDGGIVLWGSGVPQDSPSGRFRSVSLGGLVANAIVCRCPSDLIADSTVNAADMAIVLNFWGTDGSQFPGVDIDGDGIVSGSDLAAVLNAWGPCPQ